MSAGDKERPDAPMGAATSTPTSPAPPKARKKRDPTDAAITRSLTRKSVRETGAAQSRDKLVPTVLPRSPADANGKGDPFYMGSSGSASPDDYALSESNLVLCTKTPKVLVMVHLEPDRKHGIVPHVRMFVRDNDDEPERYRHISVTKKAAEQKVLPMDLIPALLCESPKLHCIVSSYAGKPLLAGGRYAALEWNSLAAGGRYAALEWNGLTWLHNNARLERTSPTSPTSSTPLDFELRRDKAGKRCVVMGGLSELAPIAFQEDISDDIVTASEGVDAEMRESAMTKIRLILGIDDSASGSEGEHRHRGSGTGGALQTLSGAQSMTQPPVSDAGLGGVQKSSPRQSSAGRATGGGHPDRSIASEGNRPNSPITSTARPSRSSRRMSAPGSRSGIAHQPVKGVSRASGTGGQKEVRVPSGLPSGSGAAGRPNGHSSSDPSGGNGSHAAGSARNDPAMLAAPAVWGGKVVLPPIRHGPGQGK